MSAHHSITSSPLHLIASSSSKGSPRLIELRNLHTIARKELRDALANKWFLLYTVAFAILSVALSFLSLAGTGAYGFAGFGRTAAGLLNLIMLIVPLMALTIGAGSITSERERGMLIYLLAQPLSRGEVLLGKFLGLSLALLASLCFGFGASAALLALRSESAGVADFVSMVAYTYVLALAMLSLGLLISSYARRTGVATGVALFVWLFLVFISDLGLMAGTLVFKLQVEQLFALAVANPLQAFKFTVMQNLHASLDVLGPAGLYATQTYGKMLPWILRAVLAAWIIIPVMLSLFIFSRRSPL